MKLRVYLQLAVFFAISLSASAVPYSAGNGTSGNPYQITSAAQMDSVRHYLNSSFKLMANIDLTASIPDWTPLGTNAARYSGTFDGNGHIVKMKITSAPFHGLGLFSYNAGTIKNLGVIANITGLTFTTGGLVGFNYGNISGCYVTGVVKGLEDIGGLVGENHGTITSCYTTCAVYANSYFGGVVGYNWHLGTIMNCYSTSELYGIDTNIFMFGGIVGYNYAINSAGSLINNCYSAGFIVGSHTQSSYGSIGGGNGNLSSGGISKIINCYYDSMATGRYKGVGDTLLGIKITKVYGKRTLAMRYDTTFKMFDFNHTWKITNEKTYPALDSVSNNAPFAFRDTLQGHGTLALSSLLRNDYDVETRQTKLVYRILKVYGNGTINPNRNYTFPVNSVKGYKDSLRYQVGELVAFNVGTDTLWGGSSKASITLTNVAPSITSAARVTATQGTQYSYTVSASDANGDMLNYLLAQAPTGMAINNSQISWTPGTGVLTSGLVILKVTDGIDTTSQTFTIAVAPPTIPVNPTNPTEVKSPELQDILLYPNPVKDVLTISTPNNNTHAFIIKIYNAKGGQVIETKITDGTINLQSLLSGIYYLKIEDKTFRLIKL